MGTQALFEKRKETTLKLQNKKPLTEESGMLFLVADMRLYTLPCWSVRQSICNICELRSQLDCRVSGLVTQYCPWDKTFKEKLSNECQL